MGPKRGVLGTFCEINTKSGKAPKLGIRKTVRFFCMYPLFVGNIYVFSDCTFDFAQKCEKKCIDFSNSRTWHKKNAQQLVSNLLPNGTVFCDFTQKLWKYLCVFRTHVWIFTKNAKKKLLIYCQMGHFFAILLKSCENIYVFFEYTFGFSQKMWKKSIGFFLRIEIVAAIKKTGGAIRDPRPAL